MAKWLDKYEQGGLVLKQKTHDNYGKKANPNDVQASVGPGFVGLGYNTKGRDYSPAWGGQFAMGGSLPGAVGFTYARTQSPAPSNGPYAKKTKASAQNGKEMKYWQDGLDFKPKSISKNGSVIKDDMGQWAHPGEITQINSNDITMQGVPYPVLGISDTGHTQMMQPGQDYKFKGNKVTEYPMAQDGTRLNVDLKKQAEEFLAKRNANRNTISQYTPKAGEQERLNAEKSARLEEANKPLNKAASSKYAANAMNNIVDPMIAIEAGIGGGKLIKAGAEATGKYLTEETALKNAYKLNPYAFKPNSEAYYRMLGTGEDVLESGLIRPNPNNIAPDGVQRFAVSHFSKGRPWNTRELGTAGYEGPYMAELSNYPMEGFTAAGWPKESLGHVPIDIPNVKLYKENWLKGYKEVPKPTSTQQVTRGPINWWEEPGFMKRNPNFNAQAYANSPVGNPSAPRDIPKGMEPRLSKDKNGGWLNKYK